MFVSKLERFGEIPSSGKYLTWITKPKFALAKHFWRLEQIFPFSGRTQQPRNSPRYRFLDDWKRGRMMQSRDVRNVGKKYAFCKKVSYSKDSFWYKKGNGIRIFRVPNEWKWTENVSRFEELQKKALMGKTAIKEYSHWIFHWNFWFGENWSVNWNWDQNG